MEHQSFFGAYNTYDDVDHLISSIDENNKNISLSHECERIIRFSSQKNSSILKNNNFVNKRKINKEEIINSIRTVMDPEIQCKLYDLGLIYKINISEDNNVK